MELASSTGKFAFSDILRKIQIKKVKSHVKSVVLSAHLDNGKRFIPALSTGRSYSSEIELAQEIISYAFSSDSIR